MKQFLLPLLVILTILTTSKLASQNTLLSLSGTYGIVINDHRPDISFNAIGTSLGLEDRYKKHFTVGGDIDWQRFESEPAIALPLTDPSLSPVIYSIDRHQFNIRPTIRYYFKEAFQGLYVGVFGTYSYLTVKTSDYPQNSSYLPSIYTDPPDDFWRRIGPYLWLSSQANFSLEGICLWQPPVIPE